MPKYKVFPHKMGSSEDISFYEVVDTTSDEDGHDEHFEHDFEVIAECFSKEDGDLVCLALNLLDQVQLTLSIKE